MAADRWATPDTTGTELVARSPPTSQTTMIACIAPRHAPSVLSIPPATPPITRSRTTVPRPEPMAWAMATSRNAPPIATRARAGWPTFASAVVIWGAKKTIRTTATPAAARPSTWGTAPERKPMIAVPMTRSRTMRSIVLIGRRSIATIVRDGPDSGTMIAAPLPFDARRPRPATPKDSLAHAVPRSPGRPRRHPRRRGRARRSRPPTRRPRSTWSPGAPPAAPGSSSSRTAVIGAYEAFAALGRRVAAELPQVVLGAGTIIDGPTAAIFIAAGARFIVGQSFSEDVARLCNRRRVVYIPGCGTATEIAAAEELGCEIVKLFPAAAYDGPAFVRNFLAPSPGSRIMPTNVVATAEATRAWIEAGAAALGVGGHLYPADLVASRDRTEIAARTREFLGWVRDARAAGA